jgi:ABC-2 type transport system ATP-binding protein
MAEVEQLCTQLAIIARGRIRFAGSIPELRARHGGPDYRLRVTDPARAAATAGSLPAVAATVDRDGDLLVRADPDGAARLTVELGRAGVGIHAMLPGAPSLEQLFFDLTEDREPGVGDEPTAA